MSEIEELAWVYAEGFREAKEMSHLQLRVAEEDPGELLRAQARRRRDRLHRPARQLDEGADQPRQPANLLLIGIGHAKSISVFRDPARPAESPVPSVRNSPAPKAPTQKTARRRDAAASDASPPNLKRDGRIRSNESTNCRIPTGYDACHLDMKHPSGRCRIPSQRCIVSSGEASSPTAQTQHPWIRCVSY
jgi:hypothetical protein